MSIDSLRQGVMVIALLQRSRSSAVDIDGIRHAVIGPGLLLLIGVRVGDEPTNAERLAERVLGYRVFVDGDGRMNRSVIDAGGEILAVPQFTLAADTRSGRRPGFSTAAAPASAEALFEHFCGALERADGVHRPTVRRGVFGADMQVSLVNDGPVTFWLEA